MDWVRLCHKSRFNALQSGYKPVAIMDHIMTFTGFTIKLVVDYCMQLQ